MATEEETRLDNRQLPFYFPPLQEVKDPLRKILEEYSGIPPGQVLDHLWRVVCSGVICTLFCTLTRINRESVPGMFIHILVLDNGDLRT
jgi:hypothetical protein